MLEEIHAFHGNYSSYKGLTYRNKSDRKRCQCERDITLSRKEQGGVSRPKARSDLDQTGPIKIHLSSTH